MKKLVVFSGAGISQESGLSTFRDNNGLWEKYDVTKVATPQAWEQNPKLVLEFYKKRWEQVLNAEPNEGHLSLAELQNHFNVQIITQNIDNLHERAGSKNVLHLHGRIDQARSSDGSNKTYDIKEKYIEFGETCPKGHQLRPHVVWFGEMVPNMPLAEEIIRQADLFIVVGTSLNVYPAAGLTYLVPESTPKYLVDPGDLNIRDIENITFLKKKASIGIPTLADLLIEKYT